MQRMTASVLLAVGAFVLWGPGWALLVAGALLWVRDDRAATWFADQRTRIVGLYQRAATTVRTVPRRVGAGSAMGVGLAVAPAGAAVAWGAGAALLVAGALLIGFSLLAGWGA